MALNIITIHTTKTSDQPLWTTMQQWKASVEFSNVIRPQLSNQKNNRYATELAGVTFADSDSAPVPKFWIRDRLFFKFENPTPVQTPATIIDPTEINPCFYLRNNHTGSCFCPKGVVTMGPVFHKCLTPGPKEKGKTHQSRLRISRSGPRSGIQGRWPCCHSLRSTSSPEFLILSSSPTIIQNIFLMEGRNQNEVQKFTKYLFITTNSLQPFPLTQSKSGSDLKFLCD